MAAKEHCVFCFDVLVSHLDNGKPPAPAFDNAKYPLFVTWLKDSGSSTNLRGCIGTFSAKDIHTGLHEYSLTSALKDSRFSPIAKHEVSSLTCGVSLLTNFEDCTHDDWEVGTHGIEIEYTDPNGKFRHATYLPEVAEDQGWTKTEALHSLIRKSGFEGKISNSLLSQLKVTRYQSSKVELHYKEYITLKQKSNKMDLNN